MTSLTTLPWSLKDDFLTPSYHRELLNYLGGNEMEWFYQADISRGALADPELGKQGFSHNFIRDDVQIQPNPATSLIMPLVFQIQDLIGCSNARIRCRADMTMYNPNGIVHHPHVDFEHPHMASIYYVNDSDGDTILFNEQGDQQGLGTFTEMARIKPKANRLLVFQGSHLHTGHSPKEHPNRIIINTDYG